MASEEGGVSQTSAEKNQNAPDPQPKFQTETWAPF